MKGPTLKSTLLRICGKPSKENGNVYCLFQQTTCTNVHAHVSQCRVASGSWACFCPKRSKISDNSYIVWTTALNALKNLHTQFKILLGIQVEYVPFFFNSLDLNFCYAT